MNRKDWKYKEFDCYIREARDMAGWHLCGYVQVPIGHQAWGIEDPDSFLDIPDVNVTYADEDMFDDNKWSIGLVLSFREKEEMKKAEALARQEVEKLADGLVNWRANHEIDIEIQGPIEYVDNIVSAMRFLNPHAVIAAIDGKIVISIPKWSR